VLFRRWLLFFLLEAAAETLAEAAFFGAVLIYSLQRGIFFVFELSVLILAFH
jgi:hypothetical protein